jgi:5-methylcytosine-specific restriction endonuclease McrA
VSRWIPQEIKIKVAVRDQGKCTRCGSKRNLHYHHVIPWHVSHSHSIGNIRLLCERCHLLVHKGRLAA